MKFKQLLLCAASLTLPFATTAVAQNNKDRWFEVEVILFSQLGDKSQLKEFFSDQEPLPQYRRSVDLLAEYLNPDIKSLKQQLPNCNSPFYPQDLVTKNAKLPALFIEKTLAEIAMVTDENDSGIPVEIEQNADIDTVQQDTNLTELNADINDTKLELVKESVSSLANSVENESAEELVSVEQQIKTQNLVAAAEQAFQALKFPYTPSTQTNVLCRLDKQLFETHGNHFDYNGYSVDKVPLIIDAVEYSNNNSTHLLSQNSLKLSGVIRDLRNSKNFRPILHMGWRQVAREKRKSVPVKVYAGDNFKSSYQQQLDDFNSVISKQNESEEKIQAEPLNKAEQLEQAKQLRIANILNEINNVSDDTQTLLNQLENQDFTPITEESLRIEQQVNTPPLAPLQDWFIDGFFNIHLKHYLFITADFNILDKSLAELSSAQLAEASTLAADNKEQTVQAKPIRFKQDRRVISGEVHYFDHPYMGMIVQIRPYKKTKADKS